MNILNRTFNSSILYLSVLFAVLSFEPLLSQTVIFPREDAFIRGGANADINYGSDPLLWVKKAAGETSTRKSFLKFDLSSLNSTVRSATLKLTVESVNNGAPDNYTVAFVNDDTWQENTITWNTAPTSEANITTITGVNDVSEITLNFDITTAVLQEIATDGVLSLLISSDGVGNMKFHSSEGIGTGPSLDITLENPSTINNQPEIASIMGTCDFNGGRGDTNAFNASEAIQAAGLRYTRIGIEPNLYLEGANVKPESIDEIVLLLYQEGIQPMLLIEHNPDNGALGNEQKWFDIGAAFAERFRPNSSFLVQNGITNWGITQYSAINEPLYGLTVDDVPSNLHFPVTDYIAATRGFANGVHSVSATLEVAPGGLQEVPLFRNFNPYMTGIATMFNNGTLDALDIHRYYDRRQAEFTLVNKVASHQGLIDQVKSDHGITADFKVWSTEYNARGAENDDDNAKDFVTATWDLLTVRGNDENIVSDFALAFRTYLPVSSNRNLGMAVSSFPFLGNPKGVAHQLMAIITKGFRMVEADEDTGVDILTAANGNTMWVFHNREGWSNLAGNSFVINDLPDVANILEVYRYNSWDPLIGSTGAPSPDRTIDIAGLTTVNIEDLDIGETYMFVAKENPSENDMPSVSLTIPTDETSFTEGDTIQISASASDPNGIKEVVLYAGPVRLGEFTTPPYAVDWTNVPAGTTRLLAIAKDTNGAVRLTTQDITVQHPENGVNLIASKDVYVKGGQTDDDNFGDSPALLVKTSGGNNLKRRIFLQFDVSQLTAVQEAILRLRVARSGSALHNVYFVPDDDWAENTITWNNQPEFPLEIASSSVSEEGQWTNFDITEKVREEQAGDGILSLAIWTTSTALVQYFSKESGEGNEPRLLVKESPVVSFEFPEDGAEFSPNQSIVAKVKAVSTDGATIEKVDFFVNDSLTGTDTKAPYLIKVRRKESGPFKLKATATDSEGKTSSKELNLFIAADGTSLQPTDDTYIRGGANADRNYGTSEELQIKRAGGAGFTRRCFLKFDLSEVTSDFTTAELRLRVSRNDGGNGPNNISLLFIEDDTWDEETLTWNTEPTAGDVIAIQPKDDPVAVNDWLTFDITEVVRRELTTDKKISVSVVSDGTGNFNLFSKESGLQNAPILLLDTVDFIVPPENCEALDCLRNANIDFFVAGRVGDNKVEGRIWEAAIFDQKDRKIGLKAAKGYQWEPGQRENFSITYQKQTGWVDFKIGDEQLRWQNHKEKTYSEVVAVTKSFKEGNESYITNLTVNGTQFSIVYAEKESAGLKIPVASDAQELTISGEITFFWPEGNRKFLNSFGLYFSEKEDDATIFKPFLKIFPNPITSNSKISYAIDQTSDVSIQIIDLRRRTVAQYQKSQQLQGRYEILWENIPDSNKVTSGVYFVRFTYGQDAITRLVLKR
ncbi:DNRLRE domain-containing protein [Aquimarina sp. U1-2]|uniref:CBM96 family carbohydrate-binding protein n=1 Tax=Aquimarina sp. U1-2 TaxID=2823141 RepID=UPI001AECFF2F|nr:DNRLRE domain-containing protein [Aquimarina sp. U1-2]MBP2830675.1 DNRLRE domain-containing protein [Aquimarina sp. U1-2]